MQHPRVKTLNRARCEPVNAARFLLTRDTFSRIILRSQKKKWKEYTFCYRICVRQSFGAYREHFSRKSEAILRSCSASLFETI